MKNKALNRKTSNNQTKKNILYEGMGKQLATGNPEYLISKVLQVQILRILGSIYRKTA